MDDQAARQSRYGNESKDGTNEVSTNDKKVFIQLNGPWSDSYIGTWWCLKAALLSMYGSAYSSHFRNFTKNEMKQFLASKVISKTIDNASF